MFKNNNKTAYFFLRYAFQVWLTNPCFELSPTQKGCLISSKYATKINQKHIDIFHWQITDNERSQLRCKHNEL